MRITMPQLGESVVEGTIGKWLKHEGEAVQQYEPLLEIITDKVNAEYPSPVSGTLTRILVPEGETVEVNAPIAEIAAEDETQGQAAQIAGELETNQTQPSSHTLEGVTQEAQAEVSAQVERIESGQVATEEEPHTDAGRRYSPVVRRLAQEHNIDLSQVQGTGSGGRVTKQDVEQYIERLATAPPPVAAAPAEPATRRQPEPTFTPPATEPAAPSPAQRPAAALADGDQLLPLTPMRRAIAEHMVRSAYTSPHVTSVMEVDMTRIVKYRERVKEDFERREGVPLTYVPFVIRAVAESLKEHPILNSTWTDEGIMLRKQINIGIAVGMEDGLVVPVIRNADGKSLVGLARALADLASRGRAGQLTLEDVQGGTFTVNNPGTFGTIMSTPIINQPQAGILSMEAIVKRPVVLEDDAIAIRSMMYVSLSIDHRVLDGLQAARFLQSVKQRLEGFSPESAGI